MPYGDISPDAPLKPNKGKENGACNVRSCQAEPAIYLNHGTEKWYCAGCKNQIGNDPFNKKDWERNYQPRYGYPMFESRQDIDRRLVNNPQS